MRIVKVLNNSLILAIDDDGNENILMGKGIGFHKAAGYELNQDEVEKVFVLKDRSISRNIIKLAADTDSVYFEISKSVIDYAKKTHHMELMDHIYLSLTDHIAYAVRRCKDGILFENFYSQDMKYFNPNEYDVGRCALMIVEHATGVILPEDEAGNIAYHFINAQVNHPYNEKNRRIARITEGVLDIVKYYYHMVYNEEDISYSRYLTHVRLFVQRLMSDNQLPENVSSLLYENIAAACESEFACVDAVQDYIYKETGKTMTGQEKLYLAVHINRIRN
ncbi:MAG: PRD domain-containing protein [Oribacterium sp.]|nr:PRD domain-containing protein [Oribacterium sp.]